MFKLIQIPDAPVGYYDIVYNGKIDWRDMQNFKIGVVWKKGFMMTQTAVMLNAADMKTIAAMMENL